MTQPTMTPDVAAFRRTLLDARGRTLDYARNLDGGQLLGPKLKIAQLAAFHEEMHCEAFSCTRQTLGYRPPELEEQPPANRDSGPWAGDAEIPGGEFTLGAVPEDGGFVFDNEKWAHVVKVAPFRIARAR